jgi:hypothetical protein
LQMVAEKYGFALLLVHHNTKGGTAAGSQGLIDAVRIVLNVREGNPDDNVKIISVTKNNLAPKSVPEISFVIEDGGVREDARVRYLGDDDLVPADEPVTTGGEPLPDSGQGRLLAKLRSEPRLWSGQELATRTGIPYPSARTLLSRLTSSGLVVSPKRGSFAAIVPLRAAGP